MCLDYGLSHNEKEIGRTEEGDCLCYLPGILYRAKLLPCNHYFCKECILQLVHWAGAVRCFSCPKCRKEVVLPNGSVEILVTAFFINSIQESITAMERAQSAAKGEDSLATKCPAHMEPLIAYCFDCGSLICSNCMVRD